MVASDIGIDLGTASILVYVKGKGVVLKEPSVVAFDRDTNRIKAIGEEARLMLGRTPGNIVAVRPLRQGVISDYTVTEKMIKYFIQKAMGKKNFRKPRISVCIPSGATEVEKRAFYDLIKDANIKAKSIWIVEKAIADGLGMNIDVKTSQGVMIVDVGFETTEISILSLGGIVLSKLIKVGGRNFDDVIKNAVRREYNLVIGEKTAEKVKISFSELVDKNMDAVVYGRDIVTGLPVERKIPTDLVDQSLNENVDTIIDNIKVILERTPPELAADIYRHGIFLTGGSAHTKNLDMRIAAELNLKINLAEDSMNSVVNGLARIIKDDNFKSVAYRIEGMSK